MKEDVVIECFSLLKQLNEINDLQKELQLLKKKIQIAQFNNKRYTQYEMRVDQILEQIGYSTPKEKGSDKPFLHYREVPYNGYIKVYHGGR